MARRKTSPAHSKKRPARAASGPAAQSKPSSAKPAPANKPSPAKPAAPGAPPAKTPPRPIPPAPIAHLPASGQPVQPLTPDITLEAVSSTGPGKASLSGARSGVVVVGSLNMDLVVRTEMMPLPGQTVMGQDLLQSPGGKGANQVTAAAKLWQKRTAGARLIGRVGDDLFGQNIIAALQKAKVDSSSVLVTRNTPTGTAIITTDRHGENAIVVAGGANRQLSATDLLAQRKTIESSSVLLAQLEIPHDTVACAFALAKRSNVLTILDPSPAPPEGLPESLYHVDVLTPNQLEAQLLTGIAIRTPDDARRAAERFLLRGTRVVIIKMGSQGAVVVYRKDVAVGGGEGSGGGEGEGTERGGAAPSTISGTLAHHVPGFRVPVVDTTAAGDAFSGALAVALAEGIPLRQAVRFANAAGALACTKAGAIHAMPARSQVQDLLNQF